MCLLQLSIDPCEMSMELFAEGIYVGINVKG